MVLKAVGLKGWKCISANNGQWCAYGTYSCEVGFRYGFFLVLVSVKLRIKKWDPDTSIAPFLFVFQENKGKFGVLSR